MYCDTYLLYPLMYHNLAITISTALLPRRHPYLAVAVHCKPISHTSPTPLPPSLILPYFAVAVHCKPISQGHLGVVSVPAAVVHQQRTGGQ
jgi:hypothetical protein